MTTENSQPEAQESTVYWKPDEQITIKGTELAALLHLVDLQTVALTQVPLTTLMELFSTANAAKNDIMERLANEGKLSSTPMEAVIPQAEPTLGSEAKVIPMDLNEISDEIL
jgi:hypothetical protein